MKTFVVLGMHRSATSLQAMGLARSGVHMGDNLLGPMESNPYGHWEDVDFIYFNDFILNKAGGSWNNPPPRENIISLSDELDEQIEKFINAKKREPLWGWKDPRTCLTIELFHKYLDNPHYVTVFREPIEVAKSLKERDNMPIEKGLELANIYNERIIDFLTRCQIG